MRIYSIQPQLFSQQNYVRKTPSRQDVPVEKPKEQVLFKGAKGLVGGFLFGVLGSAALSIVTGGLAVPALVATYGAMAVGAGTGYLGHKIEDKITGEDKK